jgi:hypothetical protein
MWSGSLLLELDDYRKFRHLTRHIYPVELKPDRVLELAQTVPVIFEKISHSVKVFGPWLDNMHSEF